MTGIQGPEIRRNSQELRGRTCGQDRETMHGFSCVKLYVFELFQFENRNSAEIGANAVANSRALQKSWRALPANNAH
jgi:hypothetical protein